jgi:16S rRNA (adenine1518-N6/adenine1519-N6)-dimethyltransferase
MQTLQEIRALLAQAGLSPRKQLGQSFLIDQNLLRKLLELAQVDAGQTVLEVGPGTGSLTEELLERARRVVAVEIDRGLAALLRDRLGERPNFVLVESDVLAAKHTLSRQVLEALGARVDPNKPPATASLVSNLPYGIATPLVVECLLNSWRARRGAGVAVLFDRLTFTVQKEVADRIGAGPGSKDYGPVSVLTALLGRFQAGPILPASAFWPAPKVTSRTARIDFDPSAADRLGDAAVLMELLNLSFGRRRKQIGSLIRRKDLPWEPSLVAEALDQAGMERHLRAEAIAPSQFLAAANRLAEARSGGRA